jgi:glycosyltransferase involved in cell wall biosynthesis
MKFDNDLLFNNYLKVMDEIYVPAILSQTNKNFSIAFIINEKHITKIKELFPDNIKILFFNNINEDYLKYIKLNNVEIQTRHDCDDWMSNDYVETIQKTFYENIEKFDSLVIQTQPYKLEFNTNKIFSMGFKYNESKTSMFISLCQKKCVNSVFKEKHSLMYQLVKKVINLGNGYNYLTIHGNNKLSNVLKGDVYYKNLPNLTVIIPTFNNVKYIEECLDSTVDSSIGLNCEIFVGIDNCQETLNFIKGKLNKYKDVVTFFFFKENVGPYIIKNTLTTFANSKNILFFDSDDIMLKELINEVIISLPSNDCVRFSYNDFVNPIELTNEKMYKLNGKYGEGVFAIKKNIFLKFNGFEPWRCAADSEFNQRLKNNSKKTIHIPKILFFRRRHNDSLTMTRETGAKSLIRLEYAKKIGNKKKLKIFKPLPQLKTCDFCLVDNLGNLLEHYKVLKSDEESLKELIINNDLVVKHKTNIDLLSSILGNAPVKTETTENVPVKTEINYEKINEVISRKGVYDIKSSIKPVRENIPNNRNELMEKKKGINSELLKKILPVKPVRRNNLPNIESDRKKI